MAIPPVVIVDAVRTPFGDHSSSLARWHAVDLLAVTLNKAIDHCGILPEEVDHLIVGCANPIGEQAINVARNAALAAGWPERISSHTIDAQGVSGVVALHDAYARVVAGLSRVCVVGAVASTRVPNGATSGVAVGQPFGPLVHERFAERGGLRSPGVINEHLARRHGLTRDVLDAYARHSLESARSATENGERKNYLLEIVDGRKNPTMISEDVVPSIGDLSNLQPLFETDGLITAATFATPVSGAAVVIVAHPDAISRAPLATISQCFSIGGHPLDGESGAGLVESMIESKSRNRITRIEVEEDSAVAPLAFGLASPVPGVDVNEFGGALAIGDAFGVSGLATIVSMVHDTRPDLGLAVSAGANGLSTVTTVDLHR